jgi:DNA-binding winged helix-turn-helix (wHTH) protein
MNDLSHRDTSTEPSVLEFDGFSFDRQRCVLSREGRRIVATRKVLETLACLLERAPLAVSKSELMARVWPGLIIEESGLHRNISLLRKLLSAQTGKQYLETIPKVGYRFTGDVRLKVAVQENSIQPLGADDAIESDVAPPTIPVSPIEPRLSKPLRLRRLTSLTILMCACATIVAGYSLQPASIEKRFRIVPVTTRSQERPIVAAAINAEGTQLAYAERDALFIKRLDESEASELQLPAGVTPSYVKWAPGNRRLLLSATDTQTEEPAIWMLSLDGERSRRLIRNGAWASSSPDGKRIAFVRERGAIWISGPDEAGERRFAEAPGNYRFVYPPQFSADGRYLFDGLYKPADPETTIEARRVSDGKLVMSMKLPRLQSFTLLGRDALLLSVFSSRGIPPVEIAIQRFDLEHGAVGPMQKVAQLSEATAYKLTASRDARRVALIRDRTQSDVYLADVAPRTHALQNVRRLTFDEASDFPWGWTADSKNVLFHSLRAQTFHIYEQAYDKTVAHDVFGDTRDSKWPLMTADGHWLFYFSEKYPYSDGPGSLALMRQRVGASESPQRIASFAHDDVGLRCAIHAVRCVVIDQMASSAGISELQIETGKLQHLFDVPQVSRHYQQWALSPDGGRLAFLNDTGIYIYGLSNGALERQINLRGTCALRALAWDPEGEGFYLSKTSGEIGAVTHVSETGEEAVLYTGAMSGGGWIVPSPDGAHVAFQEWIPSANVWMLEFEPDKSRAEQVFRSLTASTLQ